MKYLIVNFFLLLTLTYQACDSFDSDSDLLISRPTVSYNADDAGNIKIINSSGDSLLLYVNQKFLRGIPPDKTGAGFLLNIPSTGLVQTLKLFNSDDVATPDLIPDDEKLIKRWDVVLPENPDEQVTWLIQSGAGQASGIMILNYADYGINQIASFYSVDLYLNSKSGTRLMSLNPGMSDVRLSIPFGSYRLFFSYWYSDPNGLDPPVHAGWIETNENGLEYYAILNSSNQEQIIDVPVMYFGSVGKTGYLKLTNEFDQPLRILANNILIENYIVSDQPVTGLSTVNSGETATYQLKCGEYNLAFLNMDGAVVSEKKFCMINELYQYDLAISQSQSYQMMVIVNKTSFRLSIHDSSQGNYLGLYIDPGITKLIEYPVELNALIAINWLDFNVSITNDTLGSEWVIKYEKEVMP